MTCNVYYLSDKKGIGKREYYKDEEPSGKWYHVEIKCTNKCETDICDVCVKREEKLNTYVLSPKNTLKVSINGVLASHNNLFHRRIGEPIPVWSHAEGGIWDKEKICEGYSKKMVKFVADEKILEFVGKLEGTEVKKIAQIIAQYPKITKAAAKRYIDVSKVAPEKVMIVHPTLKEEVYDVVEVPVSKITIHAKEYYYEPVKGKVYSLDFLYIGRYDRSEQILHNEYPDSDSEPRL